MRAAGTIRPSPLPMPAMPVLKHSVALAAAWLVSPLAHAGDISGSATLTSDYVFRGVSQTRGKPALQAGVRFDTASGWYGALWASRVDFGAASDATAEVDAVAGWHGAVSKDWNADLNLTWFRYAGASEFDYVEFIATATWHERAWLMLGASDDVFASGGRGIYAQLGTRVPLGQHVRLELAAAHYQLREAYGRNYRHGQATLALSLYPQIELRLTGHATDRDARALFGDNASPRTELSFQASF